ncbi:amidohydrolase family protein [Natronobiforma cellulositropha]|uniref:amidohydrolase family protein n=1 Tax=Natronobiforma cellulositropha TaxID=1679076 RepID=UPI0021D5F9E6|nr:amidohydrolase family protein [Natronobiforma cellulositropha]
MNGIVDACLHQWTVDLEQMVDLVDPKWRERLEIKTKIQDPIGGTFVPTLPWYHASFNEDVDEEIDPERFRSPAVFDEYLRERNVDTGLLLGHAVKFIPGKPDPDYAATLVSAYNHLLAREWLAHSDRLKGGILVTQKNPTAAVAEIEKYADDPNMVTVLLYGGSDLPLGHEYHFPIYEAAAEAGLPLTIHTSGNPVHRQTAGGIPEHYVSYDSSLAQNHMANMLSMIYQGVFDRFPDLEVVWAGEGIGWLPQTMWRGTRYYRNLEQFSPPLEREPREYIRDNCWVTTYSMSALPDDVLSKYFQMVGTENVLYASGYPYWNADDVDVLPSLDDEDRDRVLRTNATRVYGV